MNDKKGKPFPKPISQETYDKVKELLYQGHEPHEIHEEARVSKSVIGRIRRSKNREDYFKTNSENASKWYKIRREKDRIAKQTSKKEIKNDQPSTFTIDPEVVAINKILAAIAAIDEYVDLKVAIALKKYGESKSINS